MDAAVIQILIQGGAVGLMVLGMGIAYKVTMKLIAVGQNLVTNHLTTLTEEVKGVREEMATLSDRLLDVLDRRAGG